MIKEVINQINRSLIKLFDIIRSAYDGYLELTDDNDNIFYDKKFFDSLSREDVLKLNDVIDLIKTYNVSVRVYLNYEEKILSSGYRCDTNIVIDYNPLWRISNNYDEIIKENKMKNLTIEQLEAKIKECTIELNQMYNSFNQSSGKENLVQKAIDKKLAEIESYFCQRSLIVEEYELYEINDGYGEVMSITDFGMKVYDGEISDDSGYAFYVTRNNEETNIEVKPSWVLGKSIRKDLRHIIFYTKDEIEAINDLVNKPLEFDDEEF